jgi:hypothetical protein
MNDQYSRLLLDIELAKKRFGEVFETAPDLNGDSLTSPIIRGALVATSRNRSAKPQIGRSGSINIFQVLRRKQSPLKPSDRSNRDMSAFGFTLTLQLLGTIVAAHTTHPVFWLLVGPMPLAIGFTLITFARQGVFQSIRKSRRMTGRRFHGTQRKESLVPSCCESSNAEILKSQWSSCAAY